LIVLFITYPITSSCDQLASQSYKLVEIISADEFASRLIILLCSKDLPDRNWNK